MTTAQQTPEKTSPQVRTDAHRIARLIDESCTGSAVANYTAKDLSNAAAHLYARELLMFADSNTGDISSKAASNKMKALLDYLLGYYVKFGPNELEYTLTFIENIISVSDKPIKMPLQVTFTAAVVSHQGYDDFVRRLKKEGPKPDSPHRINSFLEKIRAKLKLLTEEE